MYEIEPSLVDLIYCTVIMLIGEKGEDWDYYETDPDWWRLRLWIRRN